MLEAVIQQADIVSLPSWAIAALVGVIMLILGSFITRFTKHSEVTISGPVEIRVLQENDKRIETQMNKGFQDLKDMFEAQEGRMHEWKNQILDKLATMVITQEKQKWDIDQIKNELSDIREKKIGSIQIELDELKNHKTKIRYLEDEIKDLKESRHKNGGEKSPV